MGGLVTDEIVSRNTTFKRFILMRSRHCSGCRILIQKGAFGWKPVNSDGGRKVDARLCDDCASTENPK
jgi:hypothetical protein